jgi:hypothetical protein
MNPTYYGEFTLNLVPARAGLVEAFRDVVDDWTPGFEIGGDLVRELLTVQRVALVGVVGD